MSPEIVTPNDVRAALHSLVGSVLADPSCFWVLGRLVSAGDIDSAVDFASQCWDGRATAEPIFAVWLAFESLAKRWPIDRGFHTRESWLAEVHRLSASTPDSVTRWVSRATDDDLQDYLRPDPAAVADLLRRVADAPRRPLAELVELIHAAGPSVNEGCDRLHLPTWRNQLRDHDWWTGNGVGAPPGWTLEGEQSPAVVDSFQNTSMATLAINPKRAEYLVPGVIAAGQGLLVAGHEKTLKSSIAGTDLAVSLATRTPFLGYFATPERQRVLYLSGENGEATSVDTFRRVCNARHIDGSAAEGFEFSTWLPPFYDPAALAELTRRAMGFAVVIIDPAAVCMSPGAASTLSIAYAELRGVTEACKRAGAMPILIHHLRKEARISRQGLRASAGAGFAEWARQWLLLDRIGQYKPATGSHRLKMIAGGSAGHSGEWLLDVTEGNRNNPDVLGDWTVSVRPIGEVREGQAPVSIRANADAIVDALKEIGATATANEIRAKTKTNGRTFLAAVGHLIDAGTVREGFVTRSNRERMGYALADSGGVGDQ